MNRGSHCRCLLCGMERHLTEQFSGPQGKNTYRQFASISPVLSAFPTASDLILFLHTEHSAGNGNLSKDEILAELLHGTTNNGRSSTSRELLLLAVDLERASHGNGAQPIEHAAVLRHFLDRCRQRGILSGQDLELLVHFKLDELPSGDYSNASRQRMKRVLGKLRRAAKRPRRPKFDDRQLPLF